MAKGRSPGGSPGLPRNEVTRSVPDSPAHRSRQPRDHYYAPPAGACSSVSGSPRGNGRTSLWCPPCLASVSDPIGITSLKSHRGTCSFLVTQPVVADYATGCCLVGLGGFEPPTPCSQSRRASELRHSPSKSHRRPGYQLGRRCGPTHHHPPAEDTPVNLDATAGSRALSSYRWIASCPFRQSVQAFRPGLSGSRRSAAIRSASSLASPMRIFAFSMERSEAGNSVSVTVRPAPSLSRAQYPRCPSA